MSSSNALTTRPTLQSPVQDPHTKMFSHMNGSLAQMVTRLSIVEICKAWMVYRDASEWSRFLSIFFEGATVYTTWTSRLPILDFINISIEGKRKGSFIMHRYIGGKTELSPDGKRAVCKVKATITHRFDYETNNGRDAVDVDCDCRFIFFLARNEDEDEDSPRSWLVQFVKLFYDKDKFVPCSDRDIGALIASFDPETRHLLDTLPQGYARLGAMQHRLGLGYKVDPNLPTGNDENTVKMYEAIEGWLDGAAVEVVDGLLTKA